MLPPHSHGFQDSRLTLSRLKSSSWTEPLNASGKQPNRVEVKLETKYWINGYGLVLNLPASGCSGVAFLRSLRRRASGTLSFLPNLTLPYLRYLIVRYPCSLPNLTLPQFHLPLSLNFSSIGSIVAAISVMIVTKTLLVNRQSTRSSRN